MEAIEALRIVYDLAEGNQLSEDEADTPELEAQRKDQEEALELVFRALTDPALFGCALAVGGG